MNDMPHIDMTSTPDIVAHLDALGVYAIRDILTEWDNLDPELRTEIGEHAEAETKAGHAFRRLAGHETDPTRAAFYASRAENCETVARIIRERTLR